jgi:hypothetical protein
MRERGVEVGRGIGRGSLLDQAAERGKIGGRGDDRGIDGRAEEDEPGAIATGGVEGGEEIDGGFLVGIEGRKAVGVGEG